MAGEGNVSMGMTADAGDVLRQLDKIIQKQNKLSGGFQKTKQHSDGFTGSLNRGLSGSSAQIMSMAASFVSVGAAIGVVRGAWQSFQQQIDRSLQSVKTFEDAFVKLQFLGENYNDPEVRKRVHAEAVRTGFSAKEVSDAMYAQQSMTAHQTPKQRIEQFPAILDLAKTMGVSSTEVVPMFTKMSSFYQNLTGTELSNISQLAVEKGAVKDPSELSAVMPKFMAAGKVGQMDARTAAAMGVYLTGKTGTAAQAGGAMDILTRKLMLEDPDEQEAIRNLTFGQQDPTSGRKALLKRAGVAEGDNAYQRMMKLGKLGDLSASDLKDLFGEKGLKYGAAALSDTAGLATMVKDFQENTGAGTDIVKKKLDAVRDVSPEFRRNEKNKQAVSALEIAERNIPGVQAWDTADKLMRKENLERHGSLMGAILGVGRPRGWMANYDPDAAAYGLAANRMMDTPPMSFKNPSEYLEAFSAAIKKATVDIGNVSAGVANANSHVETPALGGG